MGQTIVSGDFIANSLRALKSNHGDFMAHYMNGGLHPAARDILHHPEIPSVDGVRFVMPSESTDFEFKNCVALYEALSVNPLIATDPRLWTYLAHVSFAEYMRKRRPVDRQPSGIRGAYILRHYYVEHVSTKSLLLNDISMLWWIAHLTKTGGEDPYRLTREVFTMLDYTRHLLSGSQGRNEGLRHAVLEFVIENKPLFASFKAEKVRFVMRRLNFVAGYCVFSTLAKDEIKALIAEHADEIAKVDSDGKDAKG